MLDTITQDILGEILVYLDYDIMKIYQLSSYFLLYFNYNYQHIISRLFQNNGKKIVLNHAYTIYRFYIRNNYKLYEINERMLACAASTNNLKIIKYFLENNKNINIDDALVTATNNSNSNIVKYLVENGAKISDAVIYEASEWCCLKIIKYLISIDYNYHIEIASNAFLCGYQDIAVYFIKHNYIEPHEALLKAAENGRIEIAQYAIERGAAITIEVLENASYAFHKYNITEFLLIYHPNLYREIAMLYSGNHLELIKALEYGDILYSEELLYLVVFKNNLAVLKQLLKNKKKNIVIDIRNIAITLSVRYGSYRIFTYLFKIMRGHSEYDLLYIAIFNRHLDIVKYLVEKKYYISNDVLEYTSDSHRREYCECTKYLLNSIIE
jgi:hypothetical protein